MSDPIAAAVNLAAQVARTNALIDAEAAVRRRIDMLPTYALSEARALLNAANAIARLRSDPDGPTGVAA